MRVIVVGAGGHAKVVVAALEASGTAVHTLLDDDSARWNSEVLGRPVTGPMEILSEMGEVQAVIAIGANTVRKRLSESLKAVWMPVMHPAAWVAPDVEIGPGAMIMAGAIVQPGATIGAHAIVNTGATVDHDCRIGAFAHIAPGVHLAGNVTVGEGALLGVGVSVIPGASVGEWAVVGAGAVVIEAIPANVVARGVPARF